ncbi:MAG: peptide chain release factor 2 [Candidatus Woesebacteria bacterium]|jgi:peptide chain release factor 2
MQQLQQKLSELVLQIDSAFEKLQVQQLQLQIQRLQQQMQMPDFWQDNQKAQLIAQKEAKLRARIDPWLALKSDIADISELIKEKDDDLLPELNDQLVDAQKRFADLKHDLLFDGPYDDHDAILRLSAGAGGTDAQDWTEMLQRMYLRWSEAHGMNSEVVEQSSGEEAGIKSATVLVSGPFAYGKLRSEHGVHRLVRLSPFNADNLRQTSFALVEVLPQINQPEELKIDDKDLKIDVYRAGGHGGQSVNTTDSAVRVTHTPTGITVSIQNERSQLQNKETALKVLRSKLAQLQAEQHKDKIDELKGPTKSAEWGSQIRNYVLHPYTLVKDNRTKYEEHDASVVLDGKLDGFIGAYLESNI